MSPVIPTDKAGDRCEKVISSQGHYTVSHAASLCKNRILQAVHNV